MARATTRRAQSPRTTRDRQREATRERIVEAAAEAFAERGFHGASTRDIAQRAGTNQGLITYHFRTKEELWRAVADRIFSRLRESLGAHLAALETDDLRERAREGIRHFVRFAAAHPELFRFMVEEGKRDDERMQWLVDTHLKPIYTGMLRFDEAVGGRMRSDLWPHFYYVLAGAGSTIFALAPECRRLTGLDPETEEAVETHADFVARLLVP
jgi:AcrR family transcriptional regulator